MITGTIKLLNKKKPLYVEIACTIWFLLFIHIIHEKFVGGNNSH